MSNPLRSGLSAEPQRTKQKISRRTFAQIRAEQDAVIAKYISHHADKLDSSDQRESAACVRALAGNIRAGLAS